MDGFVSYPRTDNTVYPASLPVRELVQQMVRIPEFEAGAFVLDGPMQPTRGKKETTDHPPIHPTQAVHPNALGDGPKRRVYELIVRRFIATFGPPMVTESTRADIKAGSEELLRPRLGRARPRLRADLHLRPLVRRRDPEARGGPGAGARRRAVVGRQGDPAALADQPGQADRADGGARPRHQGDARRHHPEALRPRLRLLEPADPVGDRDRDVQGVQGARAAHGDAGDDGRARARHGPDRERRDHEGRGPCGSAARCSTARRTTCRSAPRTSPR